MSWPRVTGLIGPGTRTKDYRDCPAHAIFPGQIAGWMCALVGLALVTASSYALEPHRGTPAQPDSAGSRNYGPQRSEERRGVWVRAEHTFATCPSASIDATPVEVHRTPTPLCQRMLRAHAHVLTRRAVLTGVRLFVVPDVVDARNLLHF